MPGGIDRGANGSRGTVAVGNEIVACDPTGGGGRSSTIGRSVNRVVALCSGRKGGLE